MRRRALLGFAAAAVVMTEAAIAGAQLAQGTGAPADPAAQPPQNPYGSMQAGGLAPPPPMSTAPPPTSGQTAGKLDEAKDKDAGRGLEWVWLNVEGGFSHVGLQTFNVDEENFTAGFTSTSASGGMIGAGLGMRLIFFTLGARGRIGFYKDWQIFSAGGELGFHVPLGRVEPHLSFGGGYAGLGSIQGVVDGAADAISIRGFYVRATGGLDVYITPVLSLGLGVSWEVLGLTRPGLSPDEITKLKANPNLSDLQRARADLLALEGSSYGSSLAVTGVLGLHF